MLLKAPHQCWQPPGAILNCPGPPYRCGKIDCRRGGYL